MPASSINSYLQDARNNFDAVRPAPVYADANQTIGQCQNIHISRNCYYGYHDPKNSENTHITDYEMLEPPHVPLNGTGSSQTTSRKRSADNNDYPQNKRLREEVQREKNIEPETNETMKLNTSMEDLLANLYWNTHGGNIYHLSVCL